MLSVCSYPCEVVGFAAEDFQDPLVQARMKAAELCYAAILCCAEQFYVMP